VEPQTTAARALWIDHTVEGLTHEIISIRAQLRAVASGPGGVTGAGQELVTLLLGQLAMMERQCLLVRAQLAKMHGGMTGGALPDASAESDATEALGKG
jgi:hypothetical protein